MGRGDKKTTKGKRSMGSHGNTRPKTQKKSTQAAPASVKAEKPVKAVKAKAEKTTTAKKTVTKKKEAAEE